MEVDQQIMSEDYRKELLEILYTKSFKYDPDQGFTLASGAKSDVYIDVKKTALSSAAMELIGYAFFVELKLAPVDAVGGLTLGADPLAYATALISTMHGKYLDVFIIRKEPKGHGTRQWIEGDVAEGANVIIIEDVVTTGGSTLKAIERAKEGGLNVIGVLALVDRQEGGMEKIKAETGLKCYSIFTKADLMEAHERRSKMKDEPESDAEAF